MNGVFAGDTRKPGSGVRKVEVADSHVPDSCTFGRGEFRSSCLSEAHELIGPTPRPATIADYKAVARLYFLPHLGERLLAEIDAKTVSELKTKLLRMSQCIGPDCRELFAFSGLAVVSWDRRTHAARPHMPRQGCSPSS